jgi:hypothetical protein
MAAVSNNVRNPNPDRDPTQPEIRAEDETVEVSLQPEVLKKVTAAAKASRQTPGEWIHEAVVEAIERRTRARRNRAAPKQ